MPVSISSSYKNQHHNRRLAQNNHFAAERYRDSFPYVHIRFPQLPDKLEFVGMSAAQYLPPGGRGTAKRWMRNGDTFPFVMQSIQTVQPFPMYLFNEMHTDSEHIAVPHPPQCAHWGTFPPGEGIALRHPCKHLFVWQLRRMDKHIPIFPPCHRAPETRCFQPSQKSMEIPPRGIAKCVKFDS